MINWIEYLDIDNNYTGNDIYKKCIKFVFLWINYNHFYNKRYTKEISRRYKDEKERAKALDLQEAKDRYERLKNDFLKKFNKLPSDEHFREYIVNLKTKQRINFDKNHFQLEDFLETIYQIRCNLFHGDKLVNDYNVQIIAWAYDCLQELLYELI